jgi:hypothetical protein
MTRGATTCNKKWTLICKISNSGFVYAGSKIMFEKQLFMENMEVSEMYT